MPTNNQRPPSGPPDGPENGRPSASVSQRRWPRRPDSSEPPPGCPPPGPAPPPPENSLHYCQPSRVGRRPVLRWWAGGVGVVTLRLALDPGPGFRKAMRRLFRARPPPLRRARRSPSTCRHTPTRPLRRAGHPGVGGGRCCACPAGRAGRTGCASGRAPFRPPQRLRCPPARSRVRCRPRPPPPCPAPPRPPSLVPAAAAPLAAAAAAAAAPAAPPRRPNPAGPYPAAGETEVEEGYSAVPPSRETSASPSRRSNATSRRFASPSRLSASPSRLSTLGSNMADNLSDTLKKLKITAVDRTEDSLEGCLDCLLQALTQNNMETSEKIQGSGILQLFSSLLIPQSSCTAKVANIIAEVAKNEFMRIPCVDAGLISPLVQLLNSKDQEVLLQTGRALGNICYDSHEGRNAVDQAGGAQIVIDHLRSLCSITDPANEKLLTVFCGMLMNYSNENDSLQAQLINMGVIPTLVTLLGIHYQNAALTEMCLIAFGNLAELESSKEQFASTNIAEEMVKLFKKQIEHDKREMIFEVLAPLAENDAIKLQLVEAGLVECLLEIVQQKVDSDKEDDVAELKTASDLMVLLLLGDESMQKLFEGGKGNVFQRVLSWIPSNNHQLQLAGALAIANFARNDGNCIHMVDNGIVEKLMDLLDRHVEDGNVTVQHAALSALRNLAIPVVNKAKMLSAGVTEAVLKFLKSEMPPVQFKLLGTLRMLIDAQAEAAEQLGKNIKLVERLVEWCEAKDHAGVMGESNRLLSALIRHSKSKDVIKTIVQSGGIKHLVTMATSEHVIMQNEALVALALIAALELDTAEKDLESAKLVQILHKLLADERSAPEIKYNSMVLICAVMGSESLHKEVQDLAFLDVVSKLRSHENKSVAQQASLTEQRLTVES
ncbi:rap1 GTPase-GDP dissociation stimulator 1 isoform X4 [Myotis myotis]|uniref:rap1 GTPase-GDP dissociation stimulator 1 isoform X4 n=1 Tax=Myotis myotis TaxID=51298 RepID=UPI00174D27C9|nr:rap1 GTPase-GDP dissociation stimulator 1 isoform X4 [Myotis myotis]